MTGERTVVGGRYELAEPLGRGGMAEVRRAVDTRLGRPVAVKTLRVDLATDPTFQARFRREAQAAAGLNHPNIVAVYDTGEETDPQSGVAIPYIVMELVEGSTLRDVLRDGRKILPERALELTSGVLDALSYSHRAGIVHRDIKPANVMLTPGGGIKVMDFGIARAVADTSSTMTQTAAVIGTAQYLSPEQARGETVDARSDIYSAGCLLYELLVGRPPFVGDSPVSVAYQHVREAPVPPSQLDPAVPPEIDAVTLKALAKDPGDRYQTAREMKADIGRVLAGQQATAVAPPIFDEPKPTAVAPAVLPVVEDEEFDDEPEERRSRTGLVVLLVALALLLIGGGAFAWWQVAGSDPPAVASATVPRLLTLTQEQAESRLAEERLQASIRTENGDADTKGKVTAQDPEAGASVPVGSAVTITVNAGPKTAEIPDGLVGRDVEDVVRTLERAGFTNVDPTPAEAEPEDAKEGEVLSVTPPEGSAAALGDTIVVVHATGKSPVPRLTGVQLERAREDARDAGFAVGEVTREDSDQPAGTVIGQDPEAGQVVARGTRIAVTVAREAAPPPPPSPTATETETETRPPSPSPSPTETEPESESASPTPRSSPTASPTRRSPSPTPSG